MQQTMASFGHNWFMYSLWHKLMMLRTCERGVWVSTHGSSWSLWDSSVEREEEEVWSSELLGSPFLLLVRLLPLGSAEGGRAWFPFLPPEEKEEVPPNRSPNDGSTQRFTWRGGGAPCIKFMPWMNVFSLCIWQFETGQQQNKLFAASFP